MSQFIKFYFTSSMLNMFRTLIHPSSGACDFSIVTPQWSCVLVSMCVGVSVWLIGVVSVWQAKASACHTDTTPIQAFFGPVVRQTTKRMNHFINRLFIFYKFYTLCCVCLTLPIFMTVCGAMGMAPWKRLLLYTLAYHKFSHLPVSAITSKQGYGNLLN